jgi:hypothetical protein
MSCKTVYVERVWEAKIGTAHEQQIGNKGRNNSSNKSVIDDET